VTRKRLAYFSPLRPDRSAVADYSEKLLPKLKKHYDVDLYVNQTRPSNDLVLSEFSWYTRRDYEIQRRTTNYDLNVYQLGNSHYHNFIYPVMARYPGAVILHDANIHHARALYHLKRKNPKGYVNEITWCHGASGAKVGPVIANGFHNPILYDMFPMMKLVSESARSIMVHNQFALNRIMKLMNRNRIFRIALPYSDMNLPSYSQARKNLGIEETEYVIASFGFITPGKRIGLALDAFARFQKQYPKSKYILVGETLEDEFGRWLCDKAEMIPNIQITGYVTESVFKAWLAACDVGIALRYPTQGESSDALLRIMGAGKPAIIPAYRQFLEIPDSACVHVPLWPNDSSALLNALNKLVLHPELAKSTGDNARDYVVLNHSEQKWINSIVSGIEKTMSLPNIEPLSSRCDLPHIGTAPVEECLGLSLSNWGKAATHPLVLKPLVQAIKELGIDE
jgi:glycosyltransferase involved in cell wall biosynthesis